MKSVIGLWLFKRFALRQTTYDIYRKHFDGGKCELKPFKFKFNIDKLDNVIISTVSGTADPPDFHSMYYYQYLIQPPVTDVAFFILSLRITEESKYILVEAAIDADDIINSIHFDGYDYQNYLRLKLNCF